jgi:L-Ala-D/L-Glu epimerase
MSLSTDSEPTEKGCIVKITNIETIPVSLPVGKFEDGQDKVGGRDTPSRYDAGKSAKRRHVGDADSTRYLSNVIVKIHTDEGLTGIGEAACDTTEPVRNVRDMIDRHMKPQLVGQDPLDWEYLIDLVSWDAPRGATRFATTGIDLALHDLVAKRFGVPVYNLIGGQRRTRLLASIEVPRNTPEKMVEHSYEYFKAGVRGIKAKIGSNPELDAESIKEIRKKLGPDVSIRADANRGYTVKEAITFCRLVERYDADLEVLEQPVGTLDIEGTKAVREATSIPVEIDESAFSLPMVHRFLKADAVDVINTKCAKASGIKGVRQWAIAALAADREIVIGTEWGSSAIVAAKLHLGAAVANASPVVEFTEIMIHELLMKDPPELHDGYIDVPTSPGLGFELDDDKIERYRTPD